MRHFVELSLLLAACCGLCFGLHLYIESRPTLISGTVVNAFDGRPVPGVAIFWLGLNNSTLLTESDTQGQFTALVEPRNLYFLYAIDQRFGPLLQTNIGQLVTVYSRGEQHRDVIVPAIPSTALSGHVYTDSGARLKGCEVTAMTSDPKLPGSLRYVKHEMTNVEGAYTFVSLGADRYFVRAQCRQYLPGELQRIDVGPERWRVRRSYEPLLYPQASTLARARSVTLLPGDQRSDVDFHLHAVDQYSIHGRVVLSDGSRFRHAAFSNDSMQIAPRGFSCNHFLYECQTCWWSSDDGHFRCDFLSPGLYGIHFRLQGNPPYDESRNERVSQEADVQSAVTVAGQKEDLIIKVHEVRSKDFIQPSDAETGLLKVQRVCSSRTAGNELIFVSVVGGTNKYVKGGVGSCSSEEELALPVGEYRVYAEEPNFSGRHGEKLSSLLLQHAAHAIIAKGRTTAIELQVVSKTDLLRIAMSYLRSN